MALTTHDNIIKKLIFNIETPIPENAKYFLLEIIQKEYFQKEKYQDAKYKNIFKNFPTINSTSYIFYMFMNYNDDKVINMKRYDILSNIETFIENLSEQKINSQSTLNITGGFGQKKLIGSKYVYVDNSNNSNNSTQTYNSNSTQNHQDQQNNKIKEDMSKILLNVWYVIEFFQNNQFTIKQNKK